MFEGKICSLRRAFTISTTFMALFGRNQLPHRATLSRFLAALDEASVEALRAVFLHDALARLGPGADVGGLWDRLGTRWIVFDLDGTRQAARQRALPTSVLICHHRSDVCLPCARPATQGASVGRWSAPVPRSCRPRRISGSSPLEERAMRIIEESCYGDSA
jgi:hypothetical protein